MKVLVTGATGFLGKRCCELLREKGCDILAGGRNLQKGEELKKDGFDFLTLDLNNREDLQKIPASVQAVVHCAALSSPWAAKDDFYHSNVSGTKNLLDFCELKDIGQFIYISSSSVYFNYTDRFDIKEDAQLAEPPPSHYTGSKIAAEKLIRQSSLNSIILRPRGIFGPGDQSIVPRLLKAHRLGKLPLIGDAKNLIDITYVDNVVDAVYQALNCAQHFRGEVFNISNGEPVYIWDFLKLLFARLELGPPAKKVPYKVIYAYAAISEVIHKYLLKSEPPLTRYTAALMAKSQTLDISKAQKFLQYQPRISMSEGLERVVEDLRKQND